MRRFLVVSAAVAALAAVSSPAFAIPPVPEVSVPALKYDKRVLKNGLTVYALQDRTTPTVTVQVWYDVGSKDDPEGRSGFAHLFEHILSRKTRNMPLNMVNRLTEDVGGTRNASTGSDFTNYYEVVPAEYLETMLWTHAERMARPVVDAQVFETERNVVKEELRQRVLAPPYGRLQRFVISENAYDSHPYRRTGIGSIEQLEAATIDDARAFHEAYYGPDTATLIVAGNFDKGQLDAWIDRYFGEIQPRQRPMPKRQPQAEAPRTTPRLVTAYAPNVPLPAAVSLWKIPGAAHPDMAAIKVLDYIMAEGESSRLYRSLVYDKQLATAAQSYFNDPEEGGFWATYVVVASGQRVEDAEAAALAEVARLRDAPVSDRELLEAKTELVAGELRQRETANGRAFLLGYSLASTGDPSFADKQLRDIQAVTAADVQRVARKYLQPNARVDIRYLDDSQRPAGEPDRWANPTPMPRFLTVPPATRAPLELAAEGERQAPPAPGAKAPVADPAITERPLSNGMKLVTARSGDTPLATMTLVIGGGASTDPSDRAGLANAAASLVTKGTTSRTAQQIAAELEALGAQVNAQAGADGTILSITAPLNTLDAAAAVLADMAREPTFAPEEIERERKQALDYLSVAMKEPGQLAQLVTPRVMYGAAPYGSPVQGTPDSLKAMSREDLVRHHQSWWRPQNATLVISGGIDADAAYSVAERMFGDWRAAGAAPALAVSRAGEAPKPRVVVVDLPGAGQAAVVAAVRAPERTDAAYFPMLVSNAVLGQGSQGRLFEEVRVKRALSYGANSTFPARRDDALVTATAQTKNETAAEVADVFLAQFDRLGDDLPADTLEKRKAFLTGIYARQVESGAGLGAFLANLVQQGLPASEGAAYRERLTAVSQADAAAVAARTLSPERASIVIVGDAAKFIDKLRAAHPGVEVIPAAELDLDSATLR